MYITDTTLRVILASKDMMTAGMNRALGMVQRYGDKVRGIFSTIFRTVASLQGLLIGFGGGMLAKSFISAAAEAETFRTQLVAIFDQNQALADSTLKWIRDFAAATPHMTADVIQAFVTLKAAGADVGKDMLSTLGDVSYLFRQNISDLALAFVSLEAEPLKKLGIKLEQIGKTARITFGGITHVVEKTTDAIRGKLIELLEDKFGGAMKRAEQDWASMTSLLASQWWEFKVSVMQAGVFDYLKSALTVVNARMGKLGKESEYVADMIEGGFKDAGMVLAYMADGVDSLRFLFNGLGIAGGSLVWVFAKLGEMTGIFDKEVGTSKFLAENLKIMADNLGELADRYGHNAAGAKAFFAEVEKLNSGLGKQKEVAGDLKKEWEEYFEAVSQGELDKSTLGFLDDMLDDMKAMEGLPTKDWKPEVVIDVNQIDAAAEAWEHNTDAIDALKAKVAELGAAMDYLMDTAQGVSDIMINSFIRAMDQAVEGQITKWKQVQQILRSLIADIGRFLAQEGLKELMSMGLTALREAGKASQRRSTAEAYTGEIREGAAAAASGLIASIFGKGGVSPAFSGMIPAYALGTVVGANQPHIAFVGDNPTMQEAIIPFPKGGAVRAEVKGGGGTTFNMTAVIQAGTGSDPSAIRRMLYSEQEGIYGIVRAAISEHPHDMQRAMGMR